MVALKLTLATGQTVKHFLAVAGMCGQFRCVQSDISIKKNNNKTKQNKKTTWAAKKQNHLLKC